MSKHLSVHLRSGSQDIVSKKRTHKQDPLFSQTLWNTLDLDAINQKENTLNFSKINKMNNNQFDLENQDFNCKDYD